MDAAEGGEGGGDGIEGGGRGRAGGRIKNYLISST